MNKFILGMLCLFFSTTVVHAMDHKPNKSRPTTITIPSQEPTKLQLPPTTTHCLWQSPTQFILGTESGSLYTAHPESGYEAFAKQAHKAAILALVKIDTNKFASSAADHTLKLWDLTTDKSSRSFSSVTSVLALGYHEKILAAGLNTNIHLMHTAQSEPQELLSCIHLWDLQSPDKKPYARYKKNHDQITTLAWRDDTTLISGHNSGTITLWDTRKGAITREITTSKAALKKLLYNQTTQQIAALDVDGIVSTWDSVTGQQLVTLSDYAQPKAHYAQSSNGHFSITTKQNKASCIVEYWDTDGSVIDQETLQRKPRGSSTSDMLINHDDTHIAFFEPGKNSSLTVVPIPDTIKKRPYKTSFSSSIASQSRSKSSTPLLIRDRSSLVHDESDYDSQQSDPDTIDTRDGQARITVSASNPSINNAKDKPLSTTTWTSPCRDDCTIL